MVNPQTVEEKRTTYYQTFMGKVFINKKNYKKTVEKICFT